MDTTTREKTINLRTTSSRKAVIKQAARTSGKTPTAFILDATLQRTEAVLDAPLPNPEALRSLLSRTPRWAR